VISCDCKAIQPAVFESLLDSEMQTSSNPFIFCFFQNCRLKMKFAFHPGVNPLCISVCQQVSVSTSPFCHFRLQHGTAGGTRVVDHVLLFPVWREQAEHPPGCTTSTSLPWGAAASGPQSHQYCSTSTGTTGREFS